MTYLPALDGLRALAALWVVIFHATAFTAAPVPLIRHGYLGVDVFFMLSGFVLAHVYAPVFARDGLAFYARYLCRRVARLWPVWLTVLALFALKAEIGHWSGLGGGGLRLAEDPGLWSVYALLMQSWGWIDAERINPPGWSLSYEWAASLLLPLALILFARLRSVPLCLAFAALCLFGHAIYTHLHALPSLHTAAAHGGARIAADFLAGIFLWHAWRAADGARGGEGMAWISFSLALAALLLMPPSLALDHAAVVLFAGLLWGVAGNRGLLSSWLSRRSLRALGEASYALYVVHWLIFESLWWLFDRWHLVPGTVAGWGFLAGMVVLSVGAAFVLHIAVEWPARRLLRRLAEGPAGR